MNKENLRITVGYLCQVLPCTMLNSKGKCYWQNLHKYRVISRLFWNDNLIDMNKVKYTEGLQMKQFKRIEEISHYNYNYYVGFEKDLLFGKSDDDNTTEWWLISNGDFHYLGESYCSKNDLLHLYDSVRT